MRRFDHLTSRFARHANVPSNLGTLDNPSGQALGVGQCGDSVEVTLRVLADRIVDIRCRPQGCAFTVACASAMSELARGRTLDDALEVTPEDVEAELGGLPEDHMHCARLAVNTLGEAVADCVFRQRTRPAGPGNPPEQEDRPNAHF
jgi:nitrogen fixation NifU-like protein